MHAVASLRPAARHELLDVLPAVLVRCLQVLKLLVKIRNIGLEFGCLGRKPLLNIVLGTEDKPASE